jgi:hypothetical protein
MTSRRQITHFLKNANHNSVAADNNIGKSCGGTASECGRGRSIGLILLTIINKFLKSMMA